MGEKWVSPNKRTDGLRVKEAQVVPSPVSPVRPSAAPEQPKIEGPYLCVMRQITCLDNPDERLGRWLNSQNKDGFDLLESFSLNAVDRMFIFRRR